MYVVLMIFVLKTLIVSAENFSDETKYIDLLPDKEKQEFLERIARRIFDGVQSKDDREAVSGEVSKAQMDVHDDFVQQILLEESLNRRKSDNAYLGNKNDDADSEPKREDSVKGISLEKKDTDYAGVIDLTLQDSKRMKRYSFEKTSNNSKIIHVNVNKNEEKDLSNVNLMQDKVGSDAEDIQIKSFRRNQAANIHASQEVQSDITTQRNFQKTQMINFEDKIDDNEDESDEHTEENIDKTTKDSTITQKSIVDYNQDDNINFGSTQKIFDSMESHHIATNSIENSGVTEAVEVTTNNSTNPDIKTTTESCKNDTTTERHNNGKPNARYHRSYAESIELKNSKEYVDEKYVNKDTEDNSQLDKTTSVATEIVQTEELKINTETEAIKRFEKVTATDTTSDNEFSTGNYTDVDLTTIKTEVKTTSALRTEELKVEDENNLKEVFGSVDDSKLKQVTNNKAEKKYQELLTGEVKSYIHDTAKDNDIKNQNVRKSEISQYNDTNIGKDEQTKNSYNLSNDMIKVLRSEIKPGSREYNGENANNKNIITVNHISVSKPEGLEDLIANKLVKVLRSQVKPEPKTDEKNFKDLGALYDTMKQPKESEVNEVSSSKSLQRNQPYNRANKENPYYVPIYNYSPENAFYNPHNRYGPNADDNINNVEDNRDDVNIDDDKNDDNFNGGNDRDNIDDISEDDRDNNNNDLDKNDKDLAFSDELKKESNSDEKDNDLERLLRMYYKYIRQNQRKFRFGNTKPRLNHKQDSPYKLNLPVVVQYPKFTDIILNPNDYLDMDYYYGRSMNSPLKRDRCELQKEENIIPNSSEEGHPYNVMNDEQNLKDHMSAVRQLMYSQKHFGYVPSVGHSPDETLTVKEDDIEFSKEFLRTNEKEHMNDKNIAMDYFFGRMNDDFDSETHTFVYKRHPSKNLNKKIKNQYREDFNDDEKSYIPYSKKYFYNDIEPVTPSYFDIKLNNKRYREDNYNYKSYIPYENKKYVHKNNKPTTPYLDLEINTNKKHSDDDENILYKNKNYLYGDNKPFNLDEKIYSDKLNKEDSYNKKSYIPYKSKNYVYNDIKSMTPYLEVPQFLNDKSLRAKKKKEEIKPTDYETIKKILSITDPKDLLPTLQKLLLLNLTVRAGVDVDLEPYVTVIGDMIRNDAKAMKQYDWLSTTVDVQTALYKMIDLTNKSQDLVQISEPDLQLMKYVIFLHKSVKNLKKAKDYRKHQLLLPRNKNRKKRRGVIKESGLLNRHWLIRMMQTDNLTDKLTDTNTDIAVTIDDLNDFDDFLRDLQLCLYDLHTAIKQISMITRYSTQRWFENLKELYLDTSRKNLLEVLLHVTATRLLDLVENSARNGVEEDYLMYIRTNEKEVEKTKIEFAFALTVIDNLKLQK